MIISYFSIPACAAGVPFSTYRTTTPCFPSKFNCDFNVSLSTVFTDTNCTPKAGRITLPDCSNCSVISFTSLDGIPKPIPSALTFAVAFAIFDSFIPISLPSLLISAPPELPGLIAASV